MRRPSNLMKDAPAPPPAPPRPDSPANYLDLYGLSKPPFGGSNGYILFGSHRRAFEVLVEHIINGSGMAVLYGEEGAGKTEMLHAIGDVAAEAGTPAARLDRPEHGRITLEYMAPVLQAAGPLLIDDADLLPRDCVQALQTLAATDDAPAIILTSVNDLGALAHHARTTMRLPRLGPADVRQYIERSLWMAGGTTRRLITTDALKLIIARSGGVPGTVNRLMEAAFTAGFARGDSLITAKTIEAAAGPVRIRRQEPQRSGRLVPFLATLLLLIGVAAFFYRGLTTPHATELLNQGREALLHGEIDAARKAFQHAADAGNAEAADLLKRLENP